jgi:hypothetical protein
MVSDARTTFHVLPTERTIIGVTRSPVDGTAAVSHIRRMIVTIMDETTSGVIMEVILEAIGSIAKAAV